MVKWAQEEGEGGQAAPLLHHKVCAPRWPQWPWAQQPQKKIFCFTVVEGIPSLLTLSTFPPLCSTWELAPL